METILMIHACSGAAMGKWAVRNAINVELSDVGLDEMGRKRRKNRKMLRKRLKENRRI
jgi:hypothetical protein